YVGDREVLDIVVVGAQEAAVDESPEPGQVVRASADGRRPNGPTVARSALNSFKVEGSSQRVDGLADEGATAVQAPEPVRLAMRARMRLFAMNPEDLGTGFLDNLAFFLDCWRIDPVLGVKNHRCGP